MGGPKESTTGRGGEGVDALIVTALKEEYDQVLQVNAGAWPGSSWKQSAGPHGFEVARRLFKAANGQALDVVVTWATEMGGVATALTAEALIKAYSPRCIAMCGVCAGRRGDVQIGDVIIADRLYQYDTGKLKVEIDEDGTRRERVQGDLMTYLLRADWKKQAESFAAEPITDEWVTQRPRTTEAQADWILERIFTGENPRDHADRKLKAPDFSKVLDLLWSKRFVDRGTLTLSASGRERINSLLLLHPDGLPEPRPLKVHIGPIATGNRVVEDPQIFDHLSSAMRKVVGLEMEAAALGAIGHLHRDDIPYTIVMKGVMDHADGWKSDAAKVFAARASAECLLAFLRRYLSPRDRFIDILWPGTSKPPKDPAPSALLNARHQYIPFYEPGREAILKELEAFRVAPSSASVWLIHGVGGMGKTRLMIEWTERLRRGGWVAGFLGRSASLERFQALVASGCPAVVVIDYAESRPDLAVLLEHVARARNAGRATPLRIVLLARNAADWWGMLLGRDGPTKDLLAERSPTELAPLLPLVVERLEMVREASKVFATLSPAGVAPSPIPSLEDERFKRVLYLHMAALASVRGLRFTAETLMDDILEHEEHFWLLQAKEMGGDIAEEIFVDKARRAVASLTLFGGAPSREQAEALFERVLKRVEERLVYLLARLYPGRREDASVSYYLSGLEPDLLGEAMVLRALRRVKKEGDRPEAFLDRVFEGADERALIAGMEVLGRISEDHPDEVRPWIAHWLGVDLEGRAMPALKAAKSLGLKTAHTWVGMELAKALDRNGTVELAERLEAEGVPDFTVSLREVREWVTRMLLSRHSSAAESIEARAARALWLNNLGVHQSELGQREEALTSTREAVDLFRELAKTRPDVFLPCLAMSLSNLGSRQSDLGHWEEALVSARKSADVYRALETVQPGAFQPDLAMSFSNLGQRQNDLGQREEALTSTRKAVDLYRALVKTRPETLLPYLAGSVNNLGLMQSNLGQQEEALNSTREAVDLYRALAKTRPDVFLPDLAMSLDNLGNMQSKRGQWEEAVASGQEALTMIWPFFLKWPAAFAGRVNNYFNNLRIRLKALGREPDAELLEKLAEVQRHLPPDVSS